MNNWSENVATAAAYLLLAFLGALIFTGWWKVNANPLATWLPLRRLRRISWNGIDVLIVFFTMNLVGSLVDESLRKAGLFDSLYGPPADSSTRARELLWSSALAQPLALGLIVLGLQQLRGTRLAELGLSGSRAGVNIAIGYILWLILVPLMEAVQYLALVATPQGWADEHTLTIAAHQPLEISEWLLLIADAVILAPLLEEITFRGALFGWQLRRGWEAQATIAFCALLVAALGGVRDGGTVYNPAPVVFVLVMLPGVFVVPFLQLRPVESGTEQVLTSPPTTAELAVDGESGARINRKSFGLMRFAVGDATLPRLAIFTNGLFFAAMHSAVWPTPIPLFLLGMALAWLAYRTSSVVGAVTLHALVNATAVLSLTFYNSWP